MEEATTTTTTTTSLNDLPEHLLLHILSFLPTPDTISTSLISRSFRHLWSLLSSLDFSYNFFPSHDNPTDTRQFYSEFIDRTLILRPQSPLLKFRLEFVYDDRYAFHVDSWIRYAVKNGSQELVLDFFVAKDLREEFLEDSDDEDTRFYNFHFSLLKDSNVKVLNLSHCDLTLPVNTRLWTITSMFLCGIFMTDSMVSDLLNGCPNLEILELFSCYGMANWRFCSPKLKELTLRVFDCFDSEKSFEIDCLSLLSLTLDFAMVHKIYVKDLSSLVKFDLNIMPNMRKYYGFWETAARLLGQLTHVKLLIVQNWWFKLLEAKDFFPKRTILYNLHYLNMLTGYSKSDLLGLAALLELTPNLDTMILVRQLKYSRNGRIIFIPDKIIDEQINFSLPSLRHVTIKHYGEPQNELYLIVLLKQQGVVLEKVELIPAAPVED